MMQTSQVSLAQEAMSRLLSAGGAEGARRAASQLMERLRVAQLRGVARAFQQAEQCASQFMLSVMNVQLGMPGALHEASRSADELVSSADKTLQMGSTLPQLQEEGLLAPDVDEVLGRTKHEPARRLRAEFGSEVRRLSMDAMKPAVVAQQRAAGLAGLLGERPDSVAAPAVSAQQVVSRLKADRPDFMAGVEARVAEVMTTLRYAIGLQGSWQAHGLIRMARDPVPVAGDTRQGSSLRHGPA